MLPNLSLISGIDLEYWVNFFEAGRKEERSSGVNIIEAKMRMVEWVFHISPSLLERLFYFAMEG